MFTVGDTARILAPASDTSFSHDPHASFSTPAFGPSPLPPCNLPYLFITIAFDKCMLYKKDGKNYESTQARTEDLLCVRQMR